MLRPGFLHFPGHLMHRFLPNLAGPNLPNHDRWAVDCYLKARRVLDSGPGEGPRMVPSFA